MDLTFVILSQNSMYKPYKAHTILLRKNEAPLKYHLTEHTQVSLSAHLLSHGLGKIELEAA